MVVSGLFILFCLLLVLTSYLEISNWNPLFRLYLLVQGNSKFNIDEVSNDSKIVLEFCYAFFGTKGRSPKVTFTRFKGNTIGTYNSDENKIVINLTNCKTYNSLVDVVIHEYIHHLQFKSVHAEDYHRILSMSGYNKHPLEFMASRMSEKYARAALTYLLAEKKYLNISENNSLLSAKKFL
jgi:hypothetical protein